MLCSAVFLCAEEHAEFQRHVETGEGRIAAKLSARNIVYAVTAFSDYPADLVKPVVRRIVRLKRATCDEARPDYGEYHCVEELTIFRVKGAIDENVPIFAGHLFLGVRGVQESPS